jgi:hypothetical protein
MQGPPERGERHLGLPPLLLVPLPLDARLPQLRELFALGLDLRAALVGHGAVVISL